MPNEYTKLTQAEFDKLKPISNQVIIEIILPQLYETRESGLIMVKDYNLFISKSQDSINKTDQSAPLDRVGKVVKVPDKLHWKERLDQRNPNFKEKYKSQDWKMDWKTTVEIIPGDMVAFDFHSAHHCPIIQVEDKQYRVLEYQNLIVAKRRIYFATIMLLGLDQDELIKDGFSFHCDAYGSEPIYYEKIIPLNGYCLFSRVKSKIESNLIVDHLENVDKKRGIVKYCGSRVEYFNKNYFDDIEINPGDEVIFKDEYECLLEDKSHFHMFDEELRYNQRKDILGVITNN